MVAPLPDKAAAHNRIAIHELPVVFQIAGAVAHGMGILTKQVWLIRIAVYIGLKGLQIRVHIRAQINIGVVILLVAAVILGALIVGKAAGIKLFCPGQSGFEAASICTFVAHTPDNNTGTVLIPLYAELDAVQSSIHIFRVVRKGHIPSLYMAVPIVVVLAIIGRGTMGFKIRLIDHQETVLITKLIEHRCIGIMAGTDRIEIMLLDHLQIPLHVFDRDHGTSDGIRIMAIHTSEADGLTI